MLNRNLQRDVRQAFIASWLVLSSWGGMAVVTPIVVPFSALQAATPRCSTLLRTGQPCVLCGMTRSFYSMGAGRVGEARALNPLGPALFAALSANTIVAVWIGGRHFRQGQQVKLGREHQE